MTEFDPACVDPEIVPILEEMLTADLPDLATLTPEEARAQVEATNAPWNLPVVPLASVADLEINGPAGPLHLRHYRPLEAPVLPAIVYLHGGGWTVGSLTTHDRLMRQLALGTGAAVLGVDYRLAPETPFPGPLDDGLAAVRWAREAGRGVGLDPGRLVLAGDSAGANLALACLLALRDAGEPLPRGAALFYGCYGNRSDTDSHQQAGDGRFGLSTAQMDWFWANYLGATPPGHPLAEPLHADLAGLPPLFLSVGTADVLLDDTLDLAKCLEAAAVESELKVYPGLIHAFMRMTARSAVAQQAMDDASRAIRGMLAR